MWGILALFAAAIAALFANPAYGNTSAAEFERPVARSSVELPPYLQCVPYARKVSGIQIYGDAHTWWKQAKGRYARGNQPRVGAVMAFRPHRNMRLGHVAAVSRIIDSRTVLLRHSNWSPINGRRGQIEDNVRAIDVSPNNDWSEVRVWYHPLQAIGGTKWPIHGFIYNGKNRVAAPHNIARENRKPAIQPIKLKSSKEFLDAFGSLGQPAAKQANKPAAKPAVKPKKRRDPIAAKLPGIY